MFSIVHGSVRLVIAVAKFGFFSEDVGIIDQTRGGVGTPLFGLAGVCVAQFHYVKSVFNRVSVKNGNTR